MDIKTIGIIGTGLTGKGLLELLLKYKYKIILKSRNKNNLHEVISKVENRLLRYFDKEKVKELINNVTLTTDMSELSNADLVIESVVEDFSIKKEVFKRLDEICPENCIIASNTSSLLISEIARGLRYPQRIIGIHFFNPITKMRLVEITRGEKTNEDNIHDVVTFIKKIEKEGIIVKDVPGRIVNRLIFSMINEAGNMVDENIASIKDIDNAIKIGANHPMGPFELMDLIGLDTCLEIIMNLENSLDKHKFKPANCLKEIVKKGNLGRKTGKGFYNYNH